MLKSYYFFNSIPICLIIIFVIIIIILNLNLYQKN